MIPAVGGLPGLAASIPEHVDPSAAGSSTG
jgi:hypothetical protein